MSGNEKTWKEQMNPEELKNILGVVSKEIPDMIKNIMGSVFSEEAGRNMGKAAGAYYKELKESGLPDDVAIKMTQEYMRTFTNLGELFKNVSRFDRHGKDADRERD
jgi:hypothetical protein